VSGLVVVGDVLLDTDIDGTVARTSPEAPVPVLEISRRRRRPGGAGLAALLAAAGTRPVTLIAALGTDPDSRRIIELFADRCRVLPLQLQGTPACKTRVRGPKGQLLRIDHGTGRAGDGPVSADIERAVAGADAILVADYGRGVAAHPRLRSLLTAAARQVPVVWDPHPRGPAPVPGVRAVTPNRDEAFAYTGRAPEEAAAMLVADWHAHAVVVTDGDRGAVLHRRGSATRRVPAPAPDAAPAPTPPDVCGAGDRFAGALAGALADGAGLTRAVTTAVASATGFVRAGGAGAVAVTADLGADSTPQPTAVRTPRPPTGSEAAAADPVHPAVALARRTRARGGTVVATGGCFDLLHPGHTDLLRRARALGDVLIVCVNSDASVRRNKGPSRPVVGQQDRVRLLCELGSVDAAIVFDEPTPAEVLALLRPDVWVKGDDYRGRRLPEAPVVEGFGGRIALVPLLDGYSTSRLVETVRARP